ncbi:hypothetical protein H7X65_00905 [Candidatus Parcubacteria bacterium]|nr:hypothetical protein [Candidatus Parcubacteria bacterium]
MNKSKIGFTAMIITCIYTGLSMPQQIYQVWKSHDTSGLSLFMLAMMLFTFLCWSTYGSLKEKNWNILIPNSLGALFSLILIILKLTL